MSSRINLSEVPNSNTIEKAINAQYRVLNGISDGPKFAKRRDEIEDRINTLSELRAKVRREESKLSKSYRS